MNYFFYLLLFFSSSFQLEQKGKLEKYILPVGNRGGVVIIYNQRNGISPITQGKATLYIIPENGILATKSPPTEGSSLKFYYSNSQSELLYAWDHGVDHGDTIGIYNWSNGKFIDRNDKTIDFATFIIGTQHDADSLYQQMNELNPSELLNRVSEIRSK
jgi:hypothetical protein